MAKIGKNRRHSANFKVRTQVIAGTFCGLFLSLGCRLAYLQILHGETIREEARKGRLGKVDMTARRGSIYDRHEIALATNEVLGDVVFNCSLIPSEEKDGARFIPHQKDFALDVKYIAEKLGVSPESITQQITKHLAKIAPAIAKAKADLERQKQANPNGKWRSLPVPYQLIVAKDVAWEKTEPIRNPVEEVADKSNPGALKKEKKLLEGFNVVEKTRRLYAMGEEALHVIGRLNTPEPKPGEQPKERGVMGLEQGLEEVLHGSDGKASAELDNLKRVFLNTIKIDEKHPKRDGSNIYTTIDQEIQHLVMSEAQRLQADFHPKGVSIVVLDPYTGDLLGLASTPTIDPTAPQSGMTADEREAALTDRCATYLLEPGSVLKTLTIAAGLELGKITPGDTYFCSGGLVVGNKTIHCDAGKKHKLLTILGILQHSCNIGSAQIGQHIGGVDLRMMFEKFGICDNLELPITSKRRMERDEQGRFSPESRRLSKKIDQKTLTSADLPRVSFGHSVMTTPIHVALAYGAIANGGALMKPRLVTKIVAADGSVTEIKPIKVRDVVSPKVSEEVTEMLRAVVSGGTGRRSAITGYQVAGKTGTARKHTTPVTYTSSFVGFAPASPNVKTRAVILVMVDEPQGVLTHGGDVAGPAFCKIAKKVMEIERVSKDDPNSTQLAMAKKSINNSEKKQVARGDDAGDDNDEVVKPRRRQ